MAINIDGEILHEETDFPNIYHVKVREGETVSYGYTRAWENAAKGTLHTHAIEYHGVVIPLGIKYNPNEAEKIRAEQMILRDKARQLAPASP